jgi:hypothetical protein
MRKDQNSYEYGATQSAKGTCAGHGESEMSMSTSLQGIAGRASREPEHRFQDLIRLLSVENLEWCWTFLNKKASPGVDEMQTVLLFA